jgi:hypothetical protein
MRMILYLLCILMFIILGCLAEDSKVTTGAMPSPTATNQDYPDPHGSCETSYCTDGNLLHVCDRNGVERLEENGCFLGIFGPPNEQFTLGGDDKNSNLYYAEFNVEIIGGTESQTTIGRGTRGAEYEAVNKDAPKLVILIDPILQEGLDLNLARGGAFKINDNPPRKLTIPFSRTTEEGKDKFLYKLEVSDLRIGRNTLRIDPRDDAFTIYKIWIENAKGLRIWKMKNDPCSYQSECVFDDRYNPYQLACDFAANPHVCKEKKGPDEACIKDFECISGECYTQHPPPIPTREYGHQIGDTYCY